MDAYQKQKTFPRKSLIVLCGLCSCFQTSAQTAEQRETTYSAVQVVETVLEYRQFEKVEITGSSILRKEQTQALPVQVLTRQDMQRRGLVSLREAVQSLPQVFNGSDLTEMGKSSGAFTAAGLHGMPSGTLVLFNGKRLAPYGIQSISGKERANVDLEMIPLSAVERIEVLSDGASTLYGTDAIAGVINIITRTDFKGLEIAVNQSQPKGSSGRGTMASLNWGVGQLNRDGYNLRVNVEADQYEALSSADRSYASQGRRRFEQGGQVYEADGPRVIAFSSPAWLYSPNTTQKALSGLFVNGACTADGLSYRGLVGGCRQNLYPNYDIYPERNSQKLHVSAEKILDNQVKVYTEWLFSKEQTQMAAVDWNAQSGRIVNTPGSVGYADMVANGMDPSYGFYFWQPNLKALSQKSDKSQWRAVLGVRGEWEGWDYHASVYQSAFRATELNESVSYAALGISTTGLSSPLMDSRLLEPLNEQNTLTGQLLNAKNWQQQATGRTTFSAAEVRASRAIFEVDGKDAMLGWGLEARHEKVDTRYSDRLSAPSFEGQRNNLAGYLELQVPVRSDWDVIGSLRTDRYSDVGVTHNAKLATRWAATDKWAVRGSLGTGFRAPSIGQVQVVPENFSQSSTAVTTCTPAMLAVTDRLVAQDGHEVVCPANGTASIFSNGNPELRPEKSKQMSLGMAFTPTRNFSLSADYWRVDMRDTLQFESLSAVLADPEKYASAYVVNPAVILRNFGTEKFHYLGFLLKLNNLGSSVKEGIDFDFRYRQPLDWGRVTWAAQATYMLTSKERSSSDANWVSDLAEYALSTDQVTPRWRTRWMANFEKDNMNWQLIANYTGSYKDKDVRAFNLGTSKTETLSKLRVNGYLTWDAWANYQMSRFTQWRFGVINLMNRQPAQSFYSISSAVWGVNTQNNQLMGRTLQLGMTHKF